MHSSNIYFPMNFGSGNRGCEAIIRGTSKILGLEKSRTFLYDLSIKELQLDKSMGLENIGQLSTYSPTGFLNVAAKVGHKTMQKLGVDIFLSNIYPYTEILKVVDGGDTVFFSGGDLYCYEYHAKKNTDFVNALKKKNKNINVILWGASVEKKLLNSSVIDGLKQFDKITVRESLSYKVLMKLGISDNLELYPDSAFVLEPKESDLPECFSKSDVLGINISNYVNRGFELNTAFSDALKQFIEYVIKNTDFQILLIPHVTWKNQDDRILCKLVHDLYQDSGRIHFLQMDNLQYCQIRYIISKCRFFIGARTHSMISAYSTCVPSIALGYSIKSKGIAQDLSLPEELVVDSKKIERSDILISAFRFLVKNEKSIRTTLRSGKTGYVKNAYNAKSAVEKVLQ